MRIAKLYTNIDLKGLGWTRMDYNEFVVLSRARDISDFSFFSSSSHLRRDVSSGVQHTWMYGEAHPSMFIISSCQGRLGLRQLTRWLNESKQQHTPPLPPLATPNLFKKPRSHRILPAEEAVSVIESIPPPLAILYFSDTTWLNIIVINI